MSRSRSRWPGWRTTARGAACRACLPPDAGQEHPWNLLPAHRLVNQRQKRDRLPGDGVLRSTGAPIQDWWQRAYLVETGNVLPRHFTDEARASLPGLAHEETSPLEEVFAALQVQRLRLRHDQQVPEWTG